MSLGISMSLQGLAANIARLGRVAALSESAGTKMLAAAGIETGNQVKRLMNMPQRRDPFWGAMGTDAPFGLGKRTGLTADAVIATGRVYVYGSTMYTSVAHAAPHVAQLEDGGTVSGKFWIPTAAAQTPAGADRWPGGGPAGSFVWPTKKMVNFAHGRPKNIWLVIASPKTARARATAQRGGRGKGKAQGPMAPTPGGLTFLKLFKTSVTYRPHRTFATARALMAPRFAEMGEGLLSEVVRAA